MDRSGLTAEGALYESVARGNKDTFFFRDDATALSPFEQRYGPVPPVIHELRRIPPLNGADFGRSSEFSFDVAGDVVTKPTILIDLPSWIPPEYLLQASQGLVTDLNGNTYGYTYGIAYFLFKKIQLYQDKVLLYEYSGDTLFAARSNRGSLNGAYMENRLAGFHDGSAASIGAAAAPARLRLEIPFVGTSFPSIAVRSQSFKLRLELRKLEEIVESSLAIPVTPWLVPAFTTGTSTFAPLSKIAIGQPTLQLEARHIYTDGETQKALQDSSLEIPFQRLYENTFTYNAADYAPLIKSAAAIAPCTRRLDAVHPAGRLLWFFRSQEDLRAGRRYVFTDVSGQEYYQRQSLIIASRDREPLNSPLLWNIIMNHAKEDRDCGPGIGVMNWDLGSYATQPEGSVNFGTADRPTLYTELALPANTGQPSTECTAIVDSWALYMTEGGRGMLKYGN